MKVKHSFTVFLLTLSCACTSFGDLDLSGTIADWEQSAEVLDRAMILENELSGLMGSPKGFYSHSKRKLQLPGHSEKSTLHLYSLFAQDDEMTPSGQGEIRLYVLHPGKDEALGNETPQISLPFSLTQEGVIEFLDFDEEGASLDWDESLLLTLKKELLESLKHLAKYNTRATKLFHQTTDETESYTPLQQCCFDQVSTDEDDHLAPPAYEYDLSDKRTVGPHRTMPKAMRKKIGAAAIQVIQRSKAGEQPDLRAKPEAREDVNVHDACKPALPFDSSVLEGALSKLKKAEVKKREKQEDLRELLMRKIRARAQPSDDDASESDGSNFDEGAVSAQVSHGFGAASELSRVASLVAQAEAKLQSQASGEASGGSVHSVVQEEAEASVSPSSEVAESGYSIGQRILALLSYFRSEGVELSDEEDGAWDNLQPLLADIDDESTAEPGVLVEASCAHQSTEEPKPVAEAPVDEDAPLEDVRTLFDDDAETEEAPKPVGWFGGWLS